MQPNPNHSNDEAKVRWPDTTNHEDPVVKSGSAEFEELERDVCKAYADCNSRFEDFNVMEERDLHFRAGRRVNPADFMHLMRKALESTDGEYNSFDAEAVGKYLFFFPGITIEPSRMSSVGFHIYGPPGVLGAIFSQMNELRKLRQNDRFRRQTMKVRLAETHCPDEVDRAEDGRLRLWWD